MGTNLTYIVQETIQKDPAIRQGLARQLINPRVLATYIVKQHPKLQLNLEAVRTTIRRMEKEINEITDLQSHANKFIKQAKMHLKSGIVKVAFQKGDASLELINRGFKAIEIYGGDTFRITKGQKILQILVDAENLDKIKQVFFERILTIEENICEITVIIPKNAYNEYGMWAPFINEIAINKISLVDAFSCGTEMSIFIREEDSQKTFNVLKDMIQRANE